MNWYALFIETGKEEIVKKFLRLHFDESILYSVVPKRKIPEKRAGSVYHVLKTMFPGYLFVRTNMNASVFYTLKKIPKCIRLVHNGTYYTKDNGAYYATINEKEMQPIIQLIGDGEIIDYSKIYLENSKVFVKSGPLYGMEGIIKKIDKRKKRAKILLSFMGVEKKIDVGIEILSKRG